jgi:hypothetical protein
MTSSEPSHDNRFELGFFSAWKVLVDKVSLHFAPLALQTAEPSTSAAVWRPVLTPIAEASETASSSRNALHGSETASSSRHALHGSSHPSSRTQVPAEARAETLLETLAEVLGIPWGSVALQQVLKILWEQPHHVAKFINCGTSISAASANVRHSVLVIPRYTDFTTEKQQALVSLTRTQGVHLIFAPLTCLTGFFRLAIPLILKAQGAVVPADE